MNAWRGVQRREMGKYKQPPAHARRMGGMTADYLEAVEAESDYEDDGLTASDRARKSLHRDRYDEEAEVLLLIHNTLCRLAKHQSCCSTQYRNCHSALRLFGSSHYSNQGFTLSLAGQKHASLLTSAHWT